MEIIIDPKMFISKPFMVCPKCRKREFGVLSIHSHHYVRRCRECRYDKSFQLPPLSKKIIYLDQFAISDMMKALNPKTKAYKKGKIDLFWKTLFEKLDRLCKLQLIVCPDSSIHRQESLVSPFYKALKRLYEQLSHGLTFYDVGTIKRFQVDEAFEQWIGNKQRKSIDVDSIVMGEINIWQDRLIITVDMLGQDSKFPDVLRQEREKIATDFQTVFSRWQKEKSKKFNDWYEEERVAFGRCILQGYLNDVARYQAVLLGKIPSSLNNLSFSNALTVIADIQGRLKRAGVEEADILPKTFEFLLSAKVKEIPYVRISAMLFAAIAKEAAVGRKKPPTRGMVNDIEVISAYSPYCDALFVDKECHGYLNQGPLKSTLELNQKVFSLNNKEDFIKYLDSIEKSASKSHLDKVKEVYGEDWESPYLTMFENERH